VEKIRNHKVEIEKKVLEAMNRKVHIE
jgi:hypothetical protein